MLTIREAEMELKAGAGLTPGPGSSTAAPSEKMRDKLLKKSPG